ncbi:MAG TPA: trans-aconitate 2-methyltransferase [Polyangiaceae bacterium]|jgi:trans-aconitate 2-methyltransferase
MSVWDERQYLKFADERTRPARELLARAPLSSAARVLDLGCGPGNSTELLVQRFPGADITGVDNSTEMLDRARKDVAGVAWVEADAAQYRAKEPVDLLFSNALVQWLPEHERLFPALLEQVRVGGVLAVQMPRNFEEPSHRLMRETEPEQGSPFSSWRERLQNVRELHRVGAPEFYYDLLAPHATRVDIWQTNYQHVMPDANAIVEWVKGTGLRPYLAALPAAERAHYLQRYTAEIERAYATRADGRRLFEFPRLFVVATR